jgi:hypothetical protein
MAKRKKKTIADEEFTRRALANAQRLREYGEGKLDRERREQNKKSA